MNIYDVFYIFFHCYVVRDRFLLIVNSVCIRHNVAFTLSTHTLLQGFLTSMQITSFPFKRSCRDFLDGFHHTDAPSLSSLGLLYIGRGHCCDKDFIMSHDDLMITRLYLFVFGNFSSDPAFYSLLNAKKASFDLMITRLHLLAFGNFGGDPASFAHFSCIIMRRRLCFVQHKCCPLNTTSPIPTSILRSSDTPA